MKSDRSPFRSRRLKESNQLEVTVPGLKSPVYLRAETSDLPTFHQVFDRRDYDHFDMVEQPRVIIDAGANIGLSSVYFANRFPKATIIALEPEESNFGILQKNTKAYDGVMSINAALWRADTVLDLIDPDEGHWAFQTQEVTNNHSLRVLQKAEAITVSSIMDAFKIEFVDILKLDVEGAEREILDHSSQWIGSVGLIIVELHERFKKGCEQSFDSIRNHFDSQWVVGENIFLSTTRKCRPVWPHTDNGD